MSLDRTEYTEQLRVRVLKKLDDLRHKINSGEKIPVGDKLCNQDQEYLSEVNDKIDECLSAWYY
jgi:hypothetical protein